MNDPDQKHYEIPPITEAVLGLHFATPLSKRWLQKIPAKFKSRFPVAEAMHNFRVNLNIKEKESSFGTSTTDLVGYKLWTEDRTQVLIVTATSMSTCRLPPYTDWDDLVRDTKHNFATLKAIVKNLLIKNISTRYLNRIDIPNVKDGGKTGVELNDYLIFNVSLPPYFKDMSTAAFLFSETLFDQEQLHRYTINCSSVPSPIIDHNSFMLDIEVAFLKDLSNQSEIWSTANQLRGKKNATFENCLTVQAKALFK